MTTIRSHARYLAVHPTSYGLGFAVFEGPLRLIDWGVHRATGNKNEKCLQFLDELITRYKPRVVLLEDRDRQERQRSERIRRLVRSATFAIRRKGIVLQRISHRRVRTLFESHGAKTKLQIATSIVELLPELAPHVPPIRKPWMPEDPRMGMFHAIALAFTYFLSDEHYQCYENA
jgi:hypothetical protein